MNMALGVRGRAVSQTRTSATLCADAELVTCSSLFPVAPIFHSANAQQVNVTSTMTACWHVSFWPLWIRCGGGELF